MTVEPLENGVYLSFGGDGLYYSIDDSEWVSLPSDTNTPSINVGQTIKIKGLNVKTNSIYGYFTINGRCKLSGTIMSIIYGDNPYEEKLPFDGCFSGAFYNCTSIVSVAPDFLPATTLTEYCYEFMFWGCTSLTTAPALPATTLASYCYKQMFDGCSKLNYIKMLATDISATDCLLGWVYNVASTGTFVKNPNMTSLPTGPSGIPSGWTVVDDGEDSGGGAYDDIFGEIPPESTQFEFPLYITVPLEEYNEEYDYYYYLKPPSIIIQQLRDWFFNNAEVTSRPWGTMYNIYNPNVYINGVKVEQITADDITGVVSDPFLIISEGEIPSKYTKEIVITEDNSIYIYLYSQDKL